MSIVKIQGVKRLDNALKYISQDTKTNDNLITTFDCDQDFILEDFEMLYQLREERLRKNTTNKAKMIIQSFDFRDNITKEQAHEIGIKLADKYLKGKHQYIVATHTDTDYFHNHIIFNEVRSDNLLMFDTTRQSTIDNLRIENDKLSKEYNLHIPKEKSHEDKIHYMTQREIKVREKGNSFKEKLEITIDKVIQNSTSYDDFIKNMETLGFKSKEGKHLAFLNKESNRFMRTQTLGMNYSKNSIKYRIENKGFKIHKFEYTIKTNIIDKSEDKFKNNYGLRKWASKKNVEHLQEISHLVFNEKKTIQEIESIQRTEKEINHVIVGSLQNKDTILNDLESKYNAFQDYKDSASIIVEYKNSSNKEEFKKNHYKEFKIHDTAKKNLYLLKKVYEINSFDELLSFKETTLKERNHLYTQYTKIEKEKEKEIKHKKESKRTR